MRFEVHLILVFWVTLTGHSIASSDEHEKRPNIVWLIADDLSPELGCYGFEECQTPNIDRLANQGILFPSAFATAPACSPARSAFVTGRYQTSINSHNHRTRNKKPLTADQKTIMELLQQAGYFISNRGKSDYNFKPSFKFAGKDYANRNSDQPFFAQYQLTVTHRPFKRKRHSQDKLESLTLPSRYPDHPVMRADWANYLDSIESLDRQVGEILSRLDAEGLADDTAVFFFGDHGRAHLWDKQWLYDGGIRVPLVVRLPKNGLPDEAITPGTSNRMVSLIDLYAATAWLAGITNLPDLPARNFLRNSESENQGRDMIFAARDRSGDALDRIRAVRSNQFKYIRNDFVDLPWSTRSSYKELQYPALVLMRTLSERGQLNEYQKRMMQPTRPPEELYDLKSDPEELNNLATTKEYANVLRTMRRALSEWQDKYDFDYDQPEMSAEELRKLIASKRKWYRNTMKKRGLAADTSDEQYLAWWQKELKLSK